MPSLKGAWKTVKKVANKAADYHPIIGRYKGAAEGNLLQAFGGPVGAGLTDLGVPTSFGGHGGAQDVVNRITGKSDPNAEVETIRSPGLQLAPAFQPQVDDPGNSVFSGIKDYQSVFPMKKLPPSPVITEQAPPPPILDEVPPGYVPSRSSSLMKAARKYGATKAS